jgi:osmotically-inducible protein OsmY
MLRRISTAVVALSMLVTAAAASLRQDDRIFKDATERILTYSHYTMFDDLHAEVSDGVVTITGKVTMPFKRSAIEQRIAAIDGVSRVINRVEVLPVSTFDDDLRYRVARAIYGHPSFWHYAAMANPPIHIIVERSRVTLTGVVATEVERTLAQSLAGSTSAVSVKTELRMNCTQGRRSTDEC